MTSRHVGFRTRCGCTAIWDAEITANERFWIEIIRLASNDSDPAPTLGRVQQMRRIFAEGRLDLPHIRLPDA